MEKLPTILREQIYARLRRRNDDHDNRNNDDDDAGLDMVSLRQLLREQALFVLFCLYPCTLMINFHLCYLEWWMMTMTITTQSIVNNEGQGSMLCVNECNLWDKMLCIDSEFSPFLLAYYVQVIIHCAFLCFMWRIAIGIVQIMMNHRRHLVLHCDQG